MDKYATASKRIKIILIDLFAMHFSRTIKIESKDEKNHLIAGHGHNNPSIHGQHFGTYSYS